MFSEKNCSNLIVLDNLGKTVKNIILNNQQSINIDISDLHHSIYFTQLIKKNKLYQQKINNSIKKKFITFLKP